MRILLLLCFACVLVVVLIGLLALYAGRGAHTVNKIYGGTIEKQEAVAIYKYIDRQGHLPLSQRDGYTCMVDFLLPDGTVRALSVPPVRYEDITIGQKSLLTVQGGQFVHF